MGEDYLFDRSNASHRADSNQWRNSGRTVGPNFQMCSLYRLTANGIKIYPGNTVLINTNRLQLKELLWSCMHDMWIHGRCVTCAVEMCCEGGLILPCHLTPKHLRSATDDQKLLSPVSPGGCRWVVCKICVSVALKAKALKTKPNGFLYRRQWDGNEGSVSCDFTVHPDYGRISVSTRWQVATA